MALAGDLTQVLNLAKSVLQLGANLYKASERRDEFLSNLKDLERTCESWERASLDFGLNSDRILQIYLDQAKKQLQSEEDRLKKWDNGYGWFCLSCFLSSTTDLPDNLGKSLLDLNKEITERWRKEDVVRSEAQKRAEIEAAKPRFGFERDPSYVRIINVEIEVKGALNEEGPGDGTGQIVLLYGRAGCGKSSMGRHLALNYRDAAEGLIGSAANGASTSNAERDSSLDMDGFESKCKAVCRKFSEVLYLECGEKSSLEAKQAELLDKLWWPKGSGTEKKQGDVKGKLQQLLQNKSILMVLDDVWDGTFFKDMVKVCGKHVKILVTSQKKFLCEGVLRYKTKVVDMDNIARTDSLTIFKTYAGYSDTNLPDVAKAYMEYLVDKVGGHPHAIASLAVAIDARHGKDVSQWRDLVHEYDTKLREALPANTNDVQYDQSVFTAIEVKFDRLSEQERNLMVLLAMIEASFAVESVLELFHGEMMLEGKPRGVSSSSWFRKARKQLERSQCIKIRQERGKSYWFMHSLDHSFIMSMMCATAKEILRTVLDLPDKIQGLEPQPQINAIKLLGLGTFAFKEAFIRALEVRFVMEETWKHRYWARQNSSLIDLLWLMAKNVEPLEGSFEKSRRIAGHDLWDQMCQKASYQVFLSINSRNEFHNDALKKLLISPVSRERVWDLFQRGSRWGNEKFPADEDVFFSVLSIWGYVKSPMKSYGNISLGREQREALIKLLNCASPEDKWWHSPRVQEVVLGGIFLDLQPHHTSGTDSFRGFESRKDRLELLHTCKEKGLLNPLEHCEQVYAAEVLIVLENYLRYDENQRVKVLQEALEELFAIGEMTCVPLTKMLKYLGREEDAAKLLSKYREKWLARFHRTNNLTDKDFFYAKLVSQQFFQARYALEDWDGALQDMEFYAKCVESLNIDDEFHDKPLCDFQYYWERAIVKLHLRKDLHGALKDLDDAAKRKPGYESDVIPTRIHLKFVLGDQDGIVTEVDRWLTLCAEGGRMSGFWYQESGVGKRMCRDLAGALEDLEKAFQFDPTDYEVLKQRGYVKYLTGDEEGARVDAKMALSFKSSSVRTDDDFFKPFTCLGASMVEFLGFQL